MSSTAPGPGPGEETPKVVASGGGTAEGGSATDAAGIGQGKEKPGAATGGSAPTEPLRTSRSQPPSRKSTTDGQGAGGHEAIRVLLQRDDDLDDGEGSFGDEDDVGSGWNAYLQSGGGEDLTGQEQIVFGRDSLSTSSSDYGHETRSQTSGFSFGTVTSTASAAAATTTTTTSVSASTTSRSQPAGQRPQGQQAQAQRSFAATVSDTRQADQMYPARRQAVGLHTGQSQAVRLNTTPHRQDQGYYHQWDMDDPAPTATGGFISRVQATLMPTPEQRIQRLKDDVRQLNKQLDDADTEIQAYRYHYNNLARAFQHAELERTRFKEATMGQENELSVLRRELKDAQNLAAIRGKELVGSQVFLTKADSLSMSEVIEKVSNLNEEIFQAAALLGESLMFEPAKEMTPEETKQYTEYCTKMVGSKLTAILINEATKEGAHEVNPFLVQVVLQIYLVNVCHRLAESWQPNQPQASEFLEHIYKAIRDSEEQAVSGRWRSLTRKHIRPTTDVWKEKILKPLSYICKIANWVTADEESRRAFEQKLPPIFKAVEELRLAIGEQFTSADIHLALMESDQPFIREYMEDAYGDGGSSVRGTKGRPPPPEIVLGTVGLGLKQASKDRLPNGDVVYHSVQPAKVALVSTVLEALAPPPPRTKGKAKPQVQPAAAAPTPAPATAAPPLTSSASVTGSRKPEPFAGRVTTTASGAGAGAGAGAGMKPRDGALPKTPLTVGQPGVGQPVQATVVGVHAAADLGKTASPEGAPPPATSGGGGATDGPTPPGSGAKKPDEAGSKPGDGSTPVKADDKSKQSYSFQAMAARQHADRQQPHPPATQRRTSPRNPTPGQAQGQGQARQVQESSASQPTTRAKTRNSPDTSGAPVVGTKTSSSATGQTGRGKSGCGGSSQIPGPRK